MGPNTIYKASNEIVTNILAILPYNLEKKISVSHH